MRRIKNKTFSGIIQDVFRYVSNKEEIFNNALIMYQYSRVYLDEYSEQKELREEYFESKKLFFSQIENMVKFATVQGSTIEDILISLNFYEEPDSYHINRWLIRR